MVNFFWRENSEPSCDFLGELDVVIELGEREESKGCR
jgi:hypothetical protein